MNNSLLQQIQSLNTALSQVTSVDGATRSALKELQSEIGRALESHETVADRLEEIAVRFEADHPAVGTALRQAIDALSKAGI